MIRNRIGEGKESVAFQREDDTVITWGKSLYLKKDTSILVGCVLKLA